MSSINRNIAALINSGADAMSNEYDVSIQFPWNDGATVMTVRATGFTPPQFKATTYDKKYHGTSMQFPKSEIDGQRTFKITFRLDASYELYGQFVTWNSSVIDFVSGGVTNWPAITGAVNCEAISGAYIATSPTGDDSNGNIIGDSTNAKWTYANVWVGSVGTPEFKTEDSNALTYDVEFFFGDTSAPFYNGQGIQGTAS